MREYEQSVFISYALDGESEAIVDQIDQAVQKRGLRVIDKRELGYRDSIRAFIERIGQGNYVIVVISDEYLRSPDCMCELVEIAEGRQFHDRIFPIVLSSAEIYDPVKRLEYVKYWEGKRGELARAMKEVDPANLQGIREDIDLYDRIRDQVSGLTSILKDMHTLTPDRHRDSDFREIYTAIEEKMAREGGGPREDPSQSPYMGLRYFDTSDAALFYGRETLTDELLRRLQKESFLAIVGASGSGKSSLARAGLIPAWKAATLGRVYVITPTAHPVESLAASLTHDSESVTATTTLMDDLMKDARSLRLFVRKRLSTTEGSDLLLVVDQFEETFTLCKDPTERKAFIENLVSLTDEDSEPGARVVLTLRADFYHYCAEYEKLRLALEKHQVYIGAMTPGELREAIVRPAEIHGLNFQAGLVELILSDVGTEPGALPLLSHALLETWKRREGCTLTLSGYTEAGGVKKAIARTAEGVYGGLSPVEQTIAREIFLRLTELGEGVQDTRRRVELEELTQTEDPEAVWKVLKILTDARLVTAEQDTVDVAHEALIREWGTLRKWLDENRDSLRLHRYLTESAREWERSGRDETLLVHRGGRLDDTLQLQSSFFRFSQVEQEYLEACVALQHRIQQEQRERERRLRRLLLASIVFAVLAFLLGGYAWVQRSEAAAQAKVSLARQLAAQAHLINRDHSSNQMIASLLAIQSMKLFPTGESARFLVNDNHPAIPIARMAQDAGVTSVAFSPDGRYVVSGSLDGTIRVWEAATGQELARMAHDADVISVAFSLDGQYVMSRSLDSTARVWDAATGKERARLTFDRSMYSLAFSPDGQYVVSGSWYGTARVWEAATGEELAHMIHGRRVDSVAFSSDGKYVVSGSLDGTARVWEAATGEELARMTHGYDMTYGYANYVYSVAFSPDGKYVVSGSDDGIARVWEAATGEELARLTHDGPVESVAFSPNGKYAVSGSWAGPDRVWEAATGEELVRMIHDGEVTSVAFSPDGKYVVSGGTDGTARVWEAATGEELVRMTHDGDVTSVAFSPDGRYVVVGSSDHIARVWDVTHGEKRNYMSHFWQVASIAFSPDGRYVVSGSLDGTARVWDVATGEELARMPDHAQVFSVAFSPDGQHVVSGRGDGTTLVWEAATGEELARMAHDAGVTSVAFSPDGTYVVSGSDDGTARVWDVATGEELARMTHAEISVAFSPDGHYVVSGSWDGTARVWDVATGEELARMTHDEEVISVAFSPDGRYVVSGSWDGTARVWDVATGEEIARMIHDGDVTSVAFSPDGRYVVSGSLDNTARVWEAAAGKELARMTHDSVVSSVAFSPDGRYVVSGSADGSARVWEAATGEEIARMIHDMDVTSVAFSPDGQHVVSGSTDGAVRVWEYLPERLIATACSYAPRNLTRTEWDIYIGDALPYEAVCPNLPIEP